MKLPTLKMNLWLVLAFYVFYAPISFFWFLNATVGWTGYIASFLILGPSLVIIFIVLLVSCIRRSFKNNLSAKVSLANIILLGCIQFVVTLFSFSDCGDNGGLHSLFQTYFSPQTICTGSSSFQNLFLVTYPLVIFYVVSLVIFVVRMLKKDSSVS